MKSIDKDKEKMVISYLINNEGLSEKAAKRLIEHLKGLPDCYKLVKGGVDD